jgi:hypothetical protein
MQIVGRDFFCYLLSAIRFMLYALLLLLLVVAVLRWPATEHRAAVPQTHLDSIAPVWQFQEKHSMHIAASPERVFEAIRSVRAEDVVLFRSLVAIRRGGRRGPESILNPPAGVPILDVATRTGFRYLADDPPREIVVGLAVAPNVFASMNFLVTSDGRGGSHTSTETRVHAGTKRAERKFAMYWRAIRAGSGFIRRMWLLAIRRRAESESDSR